MWRITGGNSDWLFRLGVYLLRCGDALSQLINVVFFLSDNPNESLSGRSYRQKRNWFWGKMLIVLDLAFRVFQKNHCQKAYEADQLRAANLLEQE